MDTRVAQGIGAAGLFAGTTISTFEMDLMAFEKRGENVLLVQRPHRFGAESDDRAALAVSVSVGSSVVQSADVEAIRPDSALVLDVTGWFLSDLSGVGGELPGGPMGNPAARASTGVGATSTAYPAFPKTRTSGPC